MDIDRIAVSIGKLIKKGKESALIEIYKTEIELLGGDFLTELLHRTANKIKYEREKPGRDDWQDVNYTLMRLKGDCEDFTILIGAVLLRVGYPVLLKFTASEMVASKDVFDHVVPMSWDGKEWVVLDATLSNIGLDFEGSYSKSVIYTIEGVVLKASEDYPLMWLGWFGVAIIAIVLFLKFVLGG